MVEKNKSLLVFFHGFFSELEFHSPNNFAFYDELFLKYGYSERSLAIISRAMGKPYYKKIVGRKYEIFT